MSNGQDEVESHKKKKALSIVPYRKRLFEEKFAEKFKDEVNELRLVFGCLRIAARTNRIETDYRNSALPDLLVPLGGDLSIAV